MKKKIAIFLVGLSGGAGKVVLNYFSHMPKAKYMIDIITTDIESEKLLQMYVSCGMKVYKVTPKRKSFWKYILENYRLMKDNHYDIAYAHMTLTNFFPLIIAMFCGIKIRLSHSHLAPNRKKYLFEEILAFLTKIVSTEYLACGEEAGKFLYGRSKFKILHNAVDLKKYSYSEEENLKQRKEIGISNETRVIGHVGRFDEQKNHSFLINVFNAYVKKYPNTYLVLIGDGILMDSIKKDVSEKGISGKVLFLGQVSDVYKKMMMFDVFVLPSLFEGFSLAAVEAQAVGVNCIFSDKVSKETKLTNNVEFVSLENDQKIWIDKLHNEIESKNNERVNIKKLRNVGYDINVEAKNFDEYLDFLEKKNFPK